MTVKGVASWAICRSPRPDAGLRLLCFPFAGGGVAAYRTWPEALDPKIEVWAMQLPGRDERRREPPFDRLTPLVRAMTDAIAPALTQPFALFGHSMGALIAFEFARELRRRGARQPEHLLVSGRRAPGVPSPDAALHLLSDEDIMEQLRHYNGTPRSVLDEPELMALFLPIIRADFAVNEAEPFVADRPLACPISAFGGLADPRARGPDIEAWREHTSGAFYSEMFPGDHFFVQSARGPLLRAIGDRLRFSGLP